MKFFLFRVYSFSVYDMAARKRSRKGGRRSGRPYKKARTAYASMSSKDTVGTSSSIYPNELRMVSRLSRIGPSVRQEPKYITSHYSAQGIGNTAANGSFLWSPTGPNNGTTPLTRIGDQVKFTKLIIKGFFSCLAAGASAYSPVRVIVYKSEDPSDFTTKTAATLESEIFDNLAVNSYVNSLFLPYMDVKIVADRGLGWTNGVAGLSLAGTQDTNIYGRRIIPVDMMVTLNQKVKFATGGTAVRSGAINVYMCSLASVSTQVEFNGTIRAYFTDL